MKNISTHRSLRLKSPRLLAFCLVLSCLFILGPRLYSLSYGNIDPSFNYAVNNAAASKEAFGTQFIATYGPLGYLVGNYLPKNVAKESVWLFTYALLVGLGVYLFATHYISDPKRRWLVSGALLYALAISSGGVSVEWGLLASFLLYCLVSLKLIGRKRELLIYSLSIAAALFLLTKFTLGFSSALTLVILSITTSGLGKLARTREIIGTILLFTLVFIGLGRHLGITSPAAYIKTGFIESSNFSGAMAYYDKQTIFATLFVMLAIALLIIWPLVSEKKRAARFLFILPALGTIWKYSVVRQDGHILRFLELSIPLALMIYFSLTRRIASDKVFLMAIVLLSISAVWANNLPFYGSDSFGTVIVQPITNITSGNFIHYFDVASQKRRWSEESAAGLGGAALPASMLQAIKSSSVDVFPWETSIIAANNLHWDNRPSPFSFESYDPYLDNLNTQFFASSKAPDFVVWHSTGIPGVDSIDGRHVAWDEPKTLRALLTNYKLVDSSSSFMLLQKQPKPTQLNANYLNLGVVSPDNHWRSINPTKSDNPVFANFTLTSNLRSKLRTDVLRGNVYTLTTKNTHGKTQSYRLIPENTSNGLLINDLPSNWDSLTALFKNHKALPVDDQVVQFKITVAKSSS